MEKFEHFHIIDIGESRKYITFQVRPQRLKERRTGILVFLGVLLICIKGTLVFLGVPLICVKGTLVFLCVPLICIKGRYTAHLLLGFKVGSTLYF